MVDSRLFATLLLAVVFLATQCIRDYIGFQFWLRNLLNYFELPG